MKRLVDCREINWLLVGQYICSLSPFLSKTAKHRSFFLSYVRFSLAGPKKKKKTIIEKMTENSIMKIIAAPLCGMQEKVYVKK